MATFDFGALLLEHQELIFEHFLDLPTRLSFTMTSRKHRKLFFYKELAYEYYNSCRFMEECARLGYRDLLEYSLDNGAAFELAVCEAAFEGNQVEVASYLVPIMFSKPMGARYYRNVSYIMRLFDLAGQHGSEGLFRVLNPNFEVRPNDIVTFFNLFTRQGHFEKVRHYMPSIDFENRMPPCFWAARWAKADVEYVKSTFADPTMPTQSELFLVYSSLIRLGEDLNIVYNPKAFEIFKYLIEMGLDDYNLYDQMPMGILLHQGIFDYLLKNQPDIFFADFDKFEEYVAVCPSIFALEWLLGQEDFTNSEAFYDSLWMADVAEPDQILRGFDHETRKKIELLSMNRFDSVKYLYEKHDKKYTFDLMASCIYWIKNVTELQWLVDHCSGKLNFHVLLGRMMNMRPELGMDTIKYLVSHLKSKCEPIYLRNSICAPNALELLAFAEETVPRNKLVEYIHKTDLLAAFIAIDGVYNNEQTCFLPGMVFYDRRPRPNLLLLILKWLKRFDVKIDQSILEEILDCHPSEYFKSSVHALFEGFEFRSPEPVPRMPTTVYFGPPHFQPQGEMFSDDDSSSGED